MKKLIALLAIVPSFAMAQDFSYQGSIEILCIPTEYAFNYTREQYKEKLTFVGIGTYDDQGDVSLWINEEKGTYTLMSTSKDKKVSCVLNSGKILPKS